MDLKAVFDQLRERAAMDAAFRQELERNPLGVLQRETGLGAEQLRMLGAQLSVEELAAVAGGTGDRAEGRFPPTDTPTLEVG
ncbi:MAG TPA: hypothetical protein VIK93_05160 [Limnochordales bacterium]